MKNNITISKAIFMALNYIKQKYEVFGNEENIALIFASVEYDGECMDAVIDESIVELHFDLAFSRYSHDNLIDKDCKVKIVNNIVISIDTTTGECSCDDLYCLEFDEIFSYSELTLSYDDAIEIMKKKDNIVPIYAALTSFIPFRDFRRRNNI